jgi:NAD(P) transhydrogenase
VCPDPTFLGMVTTFSLAVIAGYQSVWSVKPALHTPLMAVTNAISGLTAAGGLLCLGGGMLPHTAAQVLAASAVLVSSVNIAGGFLISQRMLDMFRRPTDPKEYNYLYQASGIAMLASLIAAQSIGVPNVHLMGYLASSICCIGAICGLSAMPTARIGKLISPF